jgi:hypothetical protein
VSQPSLDHWASILSTILHLAFPNISLTNISISEEHRYSEAAESDDELPLPQGVRVQVTKGEKPPF